MSIQINPQTKNGRWGYMVTVWDDARLVAARWFATVPPLPSEGDPK